MDVNFEPQVFFGVPEDMKFYRVLNYEGIKIFIDTRIGNTDDLTLELKNFLFYKYLKINNWKIM